MKMINVVWGYPTSKGTRMTLYQEIRTAYGNFEKQRMHCYQQTLKIVEHFLSVLDECLEEKYNIWKFPYKEITSTTDYLNYIRRTEFKGLNPNPGIINYLGPIYDTSSLETSVVLGIVPIPQPAKSIKILDLVVTPTGEGFSIWFGKRNYSINLSKEALDEECISNSLEQMKKIAHTALQDRLVKNMLDTKHIALDAYGTIQSLTLVEDASKIERSQKITGFTSS